MKRMAGSLVLLALLLALLLPAALAEIVEEDVALEQAAFEPMEALDLYEADPGAEVPETVVTNGTEIEANASKSVPIDSKHFPDDGFRSYLLYNVDNGDGTFTQKELGKVRSLVCPFNNIVSLKGIEHFTNLEILHCSFNNIEKLDLSKNPKLEIPKSTTVVNGKKTLYKPALTVVS